MTRIYCAGVALVISICWCVSYTGIKVPSLPELVKGVLFFLIIFVVLHTLVSESVAR